MSISEMTYVSYFFAMLTAVFGIAAIVIFFAYDIRRCWQIVKGGKISVNRQKKPLRVKESAAEAKTELLGMKLCKSTVLLGAEDTEPLETISLLQDITMMDVE